MPGFEIELSEAARDVFMRRLQEGAKRPEHARLFEQFIERRRKDAEFDARPTRRNLRLAPLKENEPAELSAELNQHDFEELERAIKDLAQAINRLDALTGILVDVLATSRGVLNVLQDGKKKYNE
jgi:hypothetical protein